MRSRPRSDSLLACSAEDESFLRALDIPFVHVPLYPSTPRNLLSACIVLKDVVKAFSPDVIHSHHRFSSLAGRIVARLLKIPFVSSVQDLATGRPLVTRWALGDTISVFSDAVADHVVHEFGVNAKNVFKVSMAVRQAANPSAEERIEFRRAAGCAPDDGVVVFSGRLVEEKGPHFFLEAVPMVLQRCPEARFWIAGDGEMRIALEARARQLGVDQRVAFLGWLKDAQGCLGCADIVVVSSLREGLGRSAVEGMLMGKPVVASAIGGLVEVVGNCQGGVLIEPGRPDLIAAAVARLLGDKAQASEIGRRGRDAALRQFTSDAMARDFARIYELARTRQGVMQGNRI
jgi:glycosyltransferase involved in cell wall biosynthesis